MIWKHIESTLKVDQVDVCCPAGTNTETAQALATEVFSTLGRVSMDLDHAEAPAVSSELGAAWASTPVQICQWRFMLLTACRVEHYKTADWCLRSVLVKRFRLTSERFKYIKKKKTSKTLGAQLQYGYRFFFRYQSLISCHLPVWLERQKQEDPADDPEDFAALQLEAKCHLHFGKTLNLICCLATMHQ